MKKIINIVLLVAVTLTASCSNDKEEISEITKIIYHLHAGDVEPIQGTGLNGKHWDSSNQFVASVSDKAEIKASHIGHTTISNNLLGSLSVKVEPKITEYSEPIIYMNDYAHLFSSSDYRYNLLIGKEVAIRKYWDLRNEQSDDYKNWTLYRNTSSLRIYKTGNNATPYVAYIFEGNVLIGTGIYMHPLYASKLADFLGERFVIYSCDVVNYVANFAHGVIDSAGNLDIGFVGQVEYDSSSGFIIIAYAMNAPTSRTVENYIDLLKGAV